MLIFIYMHHIHKIEILKCIFLFCMNAFHTGCDVTCTPEQLLAELHDVNSHKLPINSVSTVKILACIELSVIFQFFIICNPYFMFYLFTM